MRDFQQNYIYQPEKKGHKNCSAREEACKCFVPLVRYHHYDCPKAKKSCPLHGGSLQHPNKEKMERTQEQKMIISFHPSSKTDRLFQPIKSLLAGSPDTKVNIQYYSPKDSPERRENIKHCHVQTSAEDLKKNVGNNVFVEKTKSFVVDKTNKMKKLKQCFYSPCSSIIRRTRSQMSIKEKNSEGIKNTMDDNFNVNKITEDKNFGEMLPPEDGTPDSGFRWFCYHYLEPKDFSRTKLDSDYVTVTHHDKNDMINHKIFEIKSKKGLNEALSYNPYNLMTQYVEEDVEDESHSKKVPVQGKIELNKSVSNMRLPLVPDKRKQDKEDKGKNLVDVGENLSDKNSESSGSIFYTPFILMPPGMEDTSSEKSLAAIMEPETKNRVHVVESSTPKEIMIPEKKDDDGTELNERPRAGTQTTFSSVGSIIDETLEEPLSKYIDASTQTDKVQLRNQSLQTSIQSYRSSGQKKNQNFASDTARRQPDETSLSGENTSFESEPESRRSSVKKQASTTRHSPLSQKPALRKEQSLTTQTGSSRRSTEPKQPEERSLIGDSTSLEDVSIQTEKEPIPTGKRHTIHMMPEEAKPRGYPEDKREPEVCLLDETLDGEKKTQEVMPCNSRIKTSTEPRKTSEKKPEQNRHRRSFTPDDVGVPLENERRRSLERNTSSFTGKVLSSHVNDVISLAESSLSALYQPSKATLEKQQSGKSIGMQAGSRTEQVRAADNLRPVQATTEPTRRAETGKVEETSPSVAAVKLNYKDPDGKFKMDYKSLVMEMGNNPQPNVKDRSTQTYRSDTSVTEAEEKSLYPSEMQENPRHDYPKHVKTQTGSAPDRKAVAKKSRIQVIEIYNRKDEPGKQPLEIQTKYSVHTAERHFKILAEVGSQTPKFVNHPDDYNTTDKTSLAPPLIRDTFQKAFNKFMHDDDEFPLEDDIKSPVSDLSEVTKMIHKFFDSFGGEQLRFCECHLRREPQEGVDAETMTDTRRDLEDLVSSGVQTDIGDTRDLPGFERFVSSDAREQTRDVIICSRCAREVVLSVSVSTNTQDLPQIKETKPVASSKPVDRLPQLQSTKRVESHDPKKMPQNTRTASKSPPKINQKPNKKPENVPATSLGTKPPVNSGANDPKTERKTNLPVVNNNNIPPSSRNTITKPESHQKQIKSNIVQTQRVINNPRSEKPVSINTIPAECLPYQTRMTSINSAQRKDYQPTGRGERGFSGASRNALSRNSKSQIPKTKSRSSSGFYYPAIVSDKSVRKRDEPRFYPGIFSSNPKGQQKRVWEGENWVDGRNYGKKLRCEESDEFSVLDFCQEKFGKEVEEYLLCGGETTDSGVELMMRSSVEGGSEKGKPKKMGFEWVPFSASHTCVQNKPPFPDLKDVKSEKTVNHCPELKMRPSRNVSTTVSLHRQLETSLKKVYECHVCKSLTCSPNWSNNFRDRRQYNFANCNSYPMIFVPTKSSRSVEEFLKQASPRKVPCGSDFQCDGPHTGNDANNFSADELCYVSKSQENYENADFYKTSEESLSTNFPSPLDERSSKESISCDVFLFKGQEKQRKENDQG